MRLSRNELIAKLRLGEDNLLGCKEVRFCGASVRGPSPSDLADELAAFANSKTGGTLLLGIDDKTRDVLGIPVDRLDLVEALVRQAGDFQESCHSLAAIQAAWIKGSARSGSGSSVGLFIHTSAG